MIFSIIKKIVNVGNIFPFGAYKPENTSHCIQSNYKILLTKTITLQIIILTRSAHTTDYKNNN